MIEGETVSETPRILSMVTRLIVRETFLACVVWNSNACINKTILTQAIPFKDTASAVVSFPCPFHECVS
jgi:hypothetical protein